MSWVHTEVVTMLVLWSQRVSDTNVLDRLADLGQSCTAGGKSFVLGNLRVGQTVIENQKSEYGIDSTCFPRLLGHPMQYI